MNIDIIHKYLDEKMTDKEFAAFELRMLKEPGLAEEVALQKDMKQFSLTQRKESAAQENLRSIGEQYRPKSMPEKKRSRLLYLLPTSIAALFILGFFLQQLMQPNQLSSEALYSQYAQIPELSFNTRSDGTDLLFIEAQTAFNNKDFQGALTIFENIIVANPTHAEARYYQAFAKIQVGDVEGGREDLRQLLDNSLFKNSSLYQLGLSYVKTDESEKAIEYFSQIPSSSNHYKSANELMVLLLEVD